MSRFTSKHALELLEDDAESLDEASDSEIDCEDECEDYCSDEIDLAEVERLADAVMSVSSSAATSRTAGFDHSLSITATSNVEIEQLTRASSNLNIAASSNSNVPASSNIAGVGVLDTDVIYFSPKRDYRWHSKPQFLDTPFNNFKPKFVSSIAIPESLSDIFKLKIYSEIVERIVIYTNIRLKAKAQRLNEDKAKLYADLTIMELYAYFGLLLLFGVTKKSGIDVHELWSNDSVHHLDYASAAMTRDRFKILTANLNFDNLELRTANLTKFSKISEIFNIFKSNIFSLIEPGASLCIDEQLYAFRGRCSFRQYMPSKPAKYGLKYWSLVDVQSSYVVSIDIYLGKTASTREGSVGESVVLKLITPFFNLETRVVTCDNFFSSVGLADKLHDRNISFVGTMRKNKREIPLEFLPNKLRTIESSVFGFSGYMSLVSYVPKKSKAVLLLSTHHHDSKVNQTVQNKPEMILFYNKNKGAVDTVDHLVENFSCRRKTKRWTFNVLLYLLDIAAHNAFCLYKMRQVNQTSNGKERRLALEKLATSLIKPLIQSRVRINSVSNFSGMRSPIIESIRRAHVSTDLDRNIVRRQRSGSISRDTRKRCELCRSSQNKYASTCNECDRYVCPTHSESIKTVICQDCIRE